METRKFCCDSIGTSPGVCDVLSQRISFRTKITDKSYGDSVKGDKVLLTLETKLKGGVRNTSSENDTEVGTQIRCILSQFT